MKTRLLLLLFTLTSTISLVYGQLSNGCAFCRQPRRNVQPTCVNCPGTPGGCGCDIDQVAPGLYECVQCGCCNYIPGTGGVCFDKTGGACNRENCSDVTLTVGLPKVNQTEMGSHQQPKDGPVAGSKLTADELVKESPWLSDAAFYERIHALAPYLGDFVHSLQNQLPRRNHLPVREGRTIEGHIYFREDYPAHFFITKDGNIWRLELSPDPEDPQAPNALEILGRKWRLIHHIHEVEDGERVVATGSY